VHGLFSIEPTFGHIFIAVLASWFASVLIVGFVAAFRGR
jgi:hypothetical protein